MAPGMTPSSDLTSTRLGLLAGSTTARQQIECSLSAAHGDDARHAFVRLFDEQARVVARCHDEMTAAGVPCSPLAGLSVSVKDLFDVAGQPTTAGSKSRGDEPHAMLDAPSVARLRQAGAALIGQTNMSEFAFSGVGINPHLGTPANPAIPAAVGGTRIPGGSTSGGAVSVACGAAWAALGSDTGGSIRIPAALQGLVGFKNTQRLTPLAGSVPLSTTLDTACAVTRSVRDAVLLHEILAARVVRLRHRPLRARRLAVPSDVMLDHLDAGVAQAFERSLRLLSDAGAELVDVSWPLLAQPARLQASGGFAAAESWAAHGPRLRERPQDFDPRVAARMRRGEAQGAAELAELHRERAAWIAAMDNVLAPFDAALSPTVPLPAPLLQPLIDSDETFFATNARLLRNCSIVNFLDGCALSLPCQEPGELPVGLMIWAGPLEDDTVLDVSLVVEAALAPSRN
jgi:aspartyl-tRNA(Asn)/glutamyl-tRNA(Gln) amidotransferase subunit A